jgi:hypothetical protein
VETARDLIQSPWTVAVVEGASLRASLGHALTLCQRLGRARSRIIRTPVHFGTNRAIGLAIPALLA